MGIKPQTSRDRLITGYWGEPRGADLVRITFDNWSYIDLWFAEDVLWDLSAKDIKEAAHAVTVSLLRDNDIETPALVNKTSRTEPGEKESQIRTAPGREGREFGTGVTNQRISDRSRIVEEAVQSVWPQENGFVACDYLAGGRVGDEDVPEPVSGIVLAFRAHVQVSSVVLHFRAKGLRPGTFLFLASRGNGLSGGCSVMKSGGGDGGEARTGWEQEPDDGGPESTQSRRGADPEQVTAASSLGKTQGVSFWVTNESVPLVQGLKHQWAEADATGVVGNYPDRDLEDRRETRLENRPPTMTLMVVPSNKAPLPAICCGVCGSSYETDCFGRSYKTYHLAVANNASLVWYIQRRFSDFLALHRDLSRGEGEDGWIAKSRLPKPPSRTFGLMKIFPETMEKFRKNQLETYIQELLTIPGALTSRSVLSFLGLLSTSSHDLMYPSTTRRETGPNGDTPLARTPPTIGRPSSISPLSSPTSSQPAVDPDERRNTSEGSRLPLPMSMSSVVVDKDTLTYAGGVFSNATCAEARKETRGAYERCCIVSGDHKGHHVGALEDDQVKGSGDSRNVEPLNLRGGGEPRNVERVSTLELAVQGGDIFLFRCRGLISRFQQWVLRSEWDHVGVVVSDGAGRPLELLESTPNGVQRNPLVDRVREYQEGGFAFKVAFRRLKLPRRTEASSRLEAFARQAEGKGYGVVFPFPGSCQSENIGPETPPALTTPSDTPQSRRVIPSEQGDVSSTTAPNCQNIDSRQLPQSYLCSQLVGAALLEMGVVRDEVGGTTGPWSWLLPAAFGQGGAVEKGLAEGVTLGEEIFVDGQELEVASAVLLDAEVS